MCTVYEYKVTNGAQYTGTRSANAAGRHCVEVNERLHQW